MKATFWTAIAFVFIWPVRIHATLVGVENLSTPPSVPAPSIQVGDQPDEGGGPRVGYDHAGGFRTGANGNGYALTAVTLDLGPTSLNGGGFTVSIYSNDPIDSVGVPGIELAQLSGGSNPVGPGCFTFVASSPLPLIASTTYWILASVPHDGSVNSMYGWYFASAINEEGLDGWSILNFSRPRGYTDGVPHLWGIAGGPIRFSVEVAAIPEAKPLLMAAAALLVSTAIVAFRRLRPANFH